MIIVSNLQELLAYLADSMNHNLADDPNDEFYTKPEQVVERFEVPMAELQKFEGQWLFYPHEEAPDPWCAPGFLAREVPDMAGLATMPTIVDPGLYVHGDWLVIANPNDGCICYTYARRAVERLVYPPKVFSYNTEKARATGEPEELEYSCYMDTVKHRKVGDTLHHQAGAPGVGYEELVITRIDETGVYAIETVNTIWVPDGSYFA